MSSKTDALYSKLRYDLQDYLDDYQFAVMASDGPMWPDITKEQAQVLSLGKALLKKFNESENPSNVACQAALDKFLLINQKSVDYVPVCQSTRDEELWGDLKMVISDFWYRDGFSLFDSPSEIISAGGVGPGASISARGHDFYTKLWDSPLTATRPDLTYLWGKTVSMDPRWGDAFTACTSARSPRIVAGNKLSFVNKNVTVARTIGTEPTINMWFQLGIGNLLAARLKEFFGIDLSNQQVVNRDLARFGSALDSYGTIDLESASDTLSMRLMQEILPRSLLRWCELTRSPVTTLPDGRSISLGMMSSMGNGFTFPLQTIIFCSVVRTAYKHLGIKPLAFGPAVNRNFGVFGDDIIVVKDAVPLVLHILKMIGCVVNQSKSFVEGPFRESCGGDYFQGHHCRGVYIKRLLSPQDYYVTINKLVRWSALTGVRVPATVKHLLAGAMTLTRNRMKYVPPLENDDAGVHVPFDKVRGVKHLPHGVVSYHYDAATAKYLVVRPDVEQIVVGQGEVPRCFNPEGLGLSFLTGCVRSHILPSTKQRGYRISLRQRDVRYITKRRITTMWDTLSPQNRALGLEWRCWSGTARDLF